MVIQIGNTALKFLICYASQKGTAQSISEDIIDQCTEHNLSSLCHLSCISDIKNINKLKDYSCIVFVGSTTGDGDPPETAQKFMRELRSEAVAQTNLSWLHYTILGLGDTNYTNFCNFGKTLDEKLEKVKALRFYNCGWADDGTGLEIVVEPWIEGLFPAIKSFLKSCETERETSLINKEIVINDFPLSEISCNISLDNMDTTINKAANTVLERKSYISPEKLKSLFPTLQLPCEDELNEHPAKKCKYSNEMVLTLPTLPSSFLLVKFSDEEVNINHLNFIKQKDSAPYPLASSEIIQCRIATCRKLTTHDAVKKSLEISLRSVLDEKQFEYEPGDSFGLIVKNKTEEVNLLLTLLQVTDTADLKVNLTVDPNTSKKSACIPKFIPRDSSLRYIFTYCLDIRNVPKKTFLRSLVEYTEDAVEKRSLMELVSKESSEVYNEIVRQQGLTFLDFLLLFPSCIPPVSLILENLPRLHPRPYSITSSPLLTPETLSFVFNVIEIPKVGSVVFKRQGLCTGWLNDLTIDLQEKGNTVVETLNKGMENLKLDTQNDNENILIYFRSNQNFRMPKELSTPLLLVGPGTGVAPFIGFLKHREAQLKSNHNENYPCIYLFFGCRHKNRDFLFKSELEYFKECGVLKDIFVSFSRDNEIEGEPKYVQDNLRLKGKEIIECINSQNGSIYVCGDAKNMSRNVFDIFVTLLQEHLQLSEIDARKYFAQMQLNNRYLQDVWA